MGEALSRLISRWVVAALIADAVLAITDASLHTSRLLTSSYLVPALAVALVANGPQTAVVAAASVLLALASGAWHSYLLTGGHLYRLAIVIASGGLAVEAAVLRARAMTARDRMELLGEVAQIADGRRELADALQRLARLLVPGVADHCLILDLQGGLTPRAMMRLGADAPPALESHLSEVLSGPLGADLIRRAAALDEAILVRDLDEGSLTPDEETRALLKDLRLSVALIAPMRTGNETLAVLVLALGPFGRRYGPEDLRFANTVASRAALAVQNARLLAELTESRLRLNAVLETLADPVTIRDLSGRVVYANDAAIASMGLSSASEIVEREPEDLFDQYIVTDEHGAPLEMSQLPSVRLLRGEKPEPLTLRFIDPRRGEERWQVLKATPLHDAHGKVDAAVTVIEDITATKRAEVQTSFLSRTSEILASSLDYEETLRNVAWLAVPELADWCAVELVDEQGVRQQVVAAHRDPEKLELAERLRQHSDTDRIDPEQGLGLVLTTGQPQLVPEILPEMLQGAARDEEHLRLLLELDMRSVLIVPMGTGSRILGAMTLVNAESGRRFGEADVRFAEQIATRAAVAVENSRLYTQRSQIAMTLQQSLLPEALPEIEGWDIASLYRPASVGGAVEVGGDFYDAFRSNGSWVMLIGDVTGKGVEAAAMTSLVRHGARFVGEHLPDPAQILARLDSALRQQSALSLCSALCLRIDGDRICLASAGHPLPLIVTDDGVRTVGASGSVLGAFADSEWPTTEFVLRPDEVLLLYTDGVTDTVGSSERFGEQRLHKTMAECGPLASDELLNCLDKSLSGFQVGPQADDTAALALRLSAQPVAAGHAAGKRTAG